MESQDFVKHFDNLDELAHHLRCFAMDAVQKMTDVDEEKSSEEDPEWDDSPNPIEFWSSEEGCQAMEFVMHMERAKKIVLKNYEKEKDDSNFDVSQDDFTAIVKNMASELFTVTSIKAAAEGLLEMAWDDDKQDFVFRKGESKNGDSNEERKEQGS